jgi:fluoride exporter
VGWKRRSLIAAGGIAGAALRWAVLTSVASPGRIPWPVLGINVAGSLVLGVLLAEEWDHPRARLLLHDFGGIGFCGGLTTFSTFAVEIVDLVRDDAVAAAVTYGVLSVVLSIAAVVAGAAVLRRVRAVAVPLEESP